MRLATFNILHGRSPRDGIVDLTRLQAAIRTLDPDILALQEVDREQPRSHLADLTAVAAEAMGARSHRFVAAMNGSPGATWVAATGAETSGASYGIALLSRYQAKNWQVLPLPRIPFRLPIWLPEPRKLIVVKEEPRTAMIGCFDTPAGQLTVANTHLSFVPGVRIRQLRRIAGHLRGSSDPVIIAGDLNLSAPLPARLTGYRSLANCGTFPLEHPVRQLDHILLRGQFRPVRAADAPVLPLSDHRALVVDFG